MTDLNLVVELDPIGDQRVVERTAVDRGIRSDLDIIADHHPPDLRDLDPPLAFLGKTEAVGADHRPRMNDRPPADHAAVVDDDVGMEERVVADRYAVANHAARLQCHVVAELHAPADDDILADACRFGHRRAHHRATMDTRSARSRWIEQGNDARVIGVGVLVHDPWQLGCGGRLRRHDDRRRQCRLQLRAVLRIGEEGDLACPRRLQRANLRDDDRPITMQHTAKPSDDLVESQTRCHRSSLR
ncbi:MAG: hypothetical protein AW07_02358 [Candidatus Accumulibacter sp. SK-11]|nr:MAG: hypothetical protein AW07_02358 [Candidatus Accumulibacter sp. SK-11]